LPVHAEDIELADVVAANRVRFLLGETIAGEDRLAVRGECLLHRAVPVELVNQFLKRIEAHGHASVVARLPAIKLTC
jgi:hypothetical protein